jgi:hypothetical protein
MHYWGFREKCQWFCTFRDQRGLDAAHDEDNKPDPMIEVLLILHFKTMAAIANGKRSIQTHTGGEATKRTKEKQDHPALVTRDEIHLMTRPQTCSKESYTDGVQNSCAGVKRRARYPHQAVVSREHEIKREPAIKTETAPALANS